MTLTTQQSDQALAVAGAAWALLDAESRGIGSEVSSALTVFGSSWNAWSSAVLAGFDGSTVPRTIRPGSWDAATANAVRSAVALVISGGMRGVASPMDRAAALDLVRGMPGDIPPSTDRGTWFVLNLAMRFPERSTDPAIGWLWECARAVRGQGSAAGAQLSELTGSIAMGTAGAEQPAASVVAQSNQNARDIIAQGSQPVTDITALTPGGQGFVIPGRAPRPQSSIPWTPIIIGTGVLALGAGLALAAAKGKIAW